MGKENCGVIKLKLNVSNHLHAIIKSKLYKTVIICYALDYYKNNSNVDMFI